MKSLLVYDLDGTLVDTADDIVCSANHMLRELGHAELSSSEIEGYVGHGLHHLLGECLKSKDEKLIERGAKIYRSFYAEHMMDHSVLFPGAEIFLETFKNRFQAVVTNKPNPYATEMLKSLRVASYFTEILGGNSGFPYKPDPAALLHLIGKHKISKKETVYIGDSAIDIEMARKADVEVIVLTHGFAKEQALRASRPDGIFHHFTELLAHAKECAWL